MAALKWRRRAGKPPALKATIYRAELQISDMDRQYYASHALTPESADVWWERFGGSARSKNFTAIEIPVRCRAGTGKDRGSQHGIAVPDPGRSDTSDERKKHYHCGTKTAHGADGAGVLIALRPAESEFMAQVPVHQHVRPNRNCRIRQDHK